MTQIGRRLLHARLMRGLSLQDLSDRMQNKVSRQALHKYEKDQVEPDNVMIQELSNALNVKPDYFYRDHPESFRDGEITFRKLSSLRKKEQNRIIETARDLLERYLELEQIIGKQPGVENPIVNITISSKSDVEIAAQKLREAWNLGTDPLYNIIGLLEDQGIKVIEIEGEDSIDGFSTWIGNSIPVIVLNQSKRDVVDRYRFTILHELGHLLLSIKDFSEKEQEKLCHYFAGAMLLDKRVIEKELGLKRKRIGLQELVAIKEQYGISIQAVMYRLKELRVISEASFKSFFQFMSRTGYKKDESKLATYHGQEKTLRFDQLIGQAIAEEYITVSKAASLKNQRLSEFRKHFLLG